MRAKSGRDIFLAGICCVVVAGALPVAHAAEEATSTSQEQMQALAASTASSNYTGNPQDAQAQNNGIPVGTQGAGATAQMMPGVFGPEQPEPEIIYQYDKKAVEGFYGVPLPKRLFNNVPSDW